MHKGRHLAILVTLIALTVAACTGTSTEKSSPSGPAATNATLNYNVNSQVMIGWDPSTGYSNEIIAMNNMYEQLTRYNAETQQVDPLLATEWTTTDDGTTWRFTIRDGVRFHSGRRMTADDVKASI